MKTKILIYVLVFIFLVTAGTVIVLNKQKPIGLATGTATVTADDEFLKQILNTYDKYKDLRPIDSKEYFSDVNNIKPKWLKPQHPAKNIVELRWLPLDPYYAKIHGLKNYYTSVINKKSGQIIVPVTILSLEKNALRCSLPESIEYTLLLWAGNGSKITGKASYNYFLDTYTPLLDLKIKESLGNKFYEKYNEDAKQGMSKNKALEKQLLWLKYEKSVKKASSSNNGILIEYTDKTKTYLSVAKQYLKFQINPPEPIDLSGPDLSQYSDATVPPYQTPPIAVYIPPPVHPASCRAAIINAIPEDVAEFSHARVEELLSDFGYEVERYIGDEVTPELINGLDEGNYGIIYICTHGDLLENVPNTRVYDNFMLMLKPLYRSIEEANRVADRWIGLGVYTLHLDDRDGEWYGTYMTPDFIDNYCNDVPFPKSFLYWFSCGTATDFPGARKLFLSFYDKGAICGWVGMDVADALITANIDATASFFNTALNEGAYLIDAVKEARKVHFHGPGNQRLLPEIIADFNSLSYIEDRPPFVDLGLRTVGQSGNSLRLTIGNEGTDNLDEGNRINIGIRDSLEEEYERTQEIDVPALQPGETFNVDIGLPLPNSSTLVIGIDIDNDIPLDVIRYNNTKNLSLSGFTPDLIIRRCSIAEGLVPGIWRTLTITLENTGIGVIQPAFDTFRVESRVRTVRGWGRWQRTRVNPQLIFINPGQTFNVTISVPNDALEVELRADSTNVVPETNENNNGFTYNIIRVKQIDIGNRF